MGLCLGQGGRRGEIGDRDLEGWGRWGPIGRDPYGDLWGGTHMVLTGRDPQIGLAPMRDTRTWHGAPREPDGA
eukprot:2380990-Pyramimonas_sp.AAC.1